MNTQIGPSRIIFYALLTSLTAFSIDALIPALLVIGDRLPSSQHLAPHHLVSLFIAGMVIGELFAGPLSDAIGRKRALLWGLVVYVAGTVMCLLAPSLEMLVAGRIVQGIGVAGPKIATRAMIRDQFAGDAMARVMSFLFSLFILVPMIAPALGQGLMLLGGWPAIFYAYLGAAIGLGAWLLWRQPETLPQDRRIPFSARRIFGNTFRILSNCRVALLIIATGLVFGAQLTYLSLSAEVLASVYGITTGLPYIFALLAGGIGLASFLNGRAVAHFGSASLARAGFWGLSLTGCALTFAALITDGAPNIALFISLSIGAFFSIGILFGNLNAMALVDLGQMAGIASSVIASVSSLIATFFALGIAAFGTETVMSLALGLLIAGAVSLVLSERAASARHVPVIPLR